jgi:hypothetical protein
MKYTIFLTALVLLSAASAAAQGTVTTQPITPISYPRSYASPPLGLAYTETLQVNVSSPGVLIQYLGLPAPTATTTATPITTSCTGTITFTNTAGMMIGRPVPFTLTPGQIFSAPLPFAMTGYSGFRGEVMASVQGTTTIPSTNLCSLSISLETFDTSTGVTHVFLPLPATGTVLPEVLSGPLSPTSMLK